MKKTLATLGLLALQLMSIEVSADVPIFRTFWEFESRVGKLKTTYSDSRDSSVIMPVNSPWNCKQYKVQITPAGTLVGGFYCAHKTQDISIEITAECVPTQPSLDAGSATILGNTKSGAAPVSLSVACMTKQINSENEHQTDDSEKRHVKPKLNMNVL